MREILFRGKWIANGNWLFGGFHSRFGRAFIIGCSKALRFEGAEVIPESIGQFTGLTDKTGKKVFEGDILKFTDAKYEYEWIGRVEFGNPNEEYNWGFQLVYIKGEKPNTDILCWFDMEEVGAFAEVIGNIHDNPELLEGGAEDGK